LSQLDAALRVSLDEVKKDLLELQKNLEVAKQNMPLVETASDLFLDTFKKTMPPFIDQAGSTAEALKKAVDDTLEEFFALLAYFGIPEQKAKSTDPESFFKSLKEFVASYESIYKAQSKEQTASEAPKKGAKPPTNRAVGQKVGDGADPLAALASAIRLGSQPLKKSGAKTLLK